MASLYTAVVIFCNTGLRNAELRRAKWSQVDFLKAEFQVGKAKTAGSEGRIVPLNHAALGAFRDWKGRWPDARPEDFIFTTQKLVFKGEGTPELGLMTSYDADPARPLGSWKRAWMTAKKQAGVSAGFTICATTSFQRWRKRKHQTPPFKPSAAISAGRCWSTTAMSG